MFRIRPVLLFLSPAIALGLLGMWDECLNHSRYHETLIRPAGFFLLCVYGAYGVVLLVCRLMASRKMPPGLCTVCGYDLRASPDTCPECGTVPLHK